MLVSELLGIFALGIYFCPKRQFSSHSARMSWSGEGCCPRGLQGPRLCARFRPERGRSRDRGQTQPHFMQGKHTSAIAVYHGGLWPCEGKRQRSHLSSNATFRSEQSHPRPFALIHPPTPSASKMGTGGAGRAGTSPQHRQTRLLWVDRVFLVGEHDPGSNHSTRGTTDFGIDGEGRIRGRPWVPGKMPVLNASTRQSCCKKKITFSAFW